MEDKRKEIVGNVIQIQRYHSPCGDLMLGSFEDRLCLCDWAVESHRGKVDRRLRKVLKACYEESTSEVIQEAIQQFRQALKAGQKCYRECVHRGRYPYPQVPDCV